MAGTYTNIAKKRVEQSKENVGVTTQQITVPSTETEITEQLNESVVPPLVNERGTKKKSAKDGKHQISGWIQMEYFEKFVKLHRSINPLLSEEVEKQYMLGLAVDTLCKIIGSNSPVFNSEEEFKKYLDLKLKDKF